MNNGASFEIFYENAYKIVKISALLSFFLSNFAPRILKLNE